MQTKILSLQQKDNLAVVQFSTTPCNTIEYSSLGNAMKQNFIEIMESSQQGTVNEIYVMNKSKFFVFMMDGDILSGAKQNRVLNTSVFLAPESKIKVPVSCVEQGRWNYNSDKFKSTDYVAPSEMRKSKSENVSANLKSFNSYQADQGDVWNKVNEYSNNLGVNSMTMSFSDLYAKSESVYDKFLQSFSAKKTATGIAFFLNKELKSVDVFNRTDIFQEYFPKMIKGIALDAYGTKANVEISEAEASFKTLDLLDRLETTEKEEHQGVGAGQEKRFSNNQHTGFELNYNGNLIHLSAHTLTQNDLEIKKRSNPYFR